MEYVEEHLTIEGLGRYRMSLVGEKLRVSLMLTLLLVVGLLVPLFPSKNPVYCVHECRLKSEVMLQYNSESYQESRDQSQPRNISEPKYFTLKDFLKVCELSQTDGARECELCKDGAKSVVTDNDVANRICPFIQIEKQLQHCAYRFVAVICWYISQNVWVYACHEELLGLLSIHDQLKKKGYCSDCVGNFIKSNDTSRCTSCRRKKFHKNSAMQTKRGKLGRICSNYLIQNGINVGVVILASCAVLLYVPDFSSWFECQIPDDIPIEGVPRLKLRNMYCLNPDLVHINVVTHVQLVILAGLFFLFGHNMMGNKKVVFSLYLGITDDKSKTS